MRNKVNTAFSLDIGLEERLGMIAKKKDRTKSYIVNKLIKEFIKENS